MSAPPFPPGLAVLSPDVTTAPFWEACRERRLRVQRCRACGRFRHPPIAGCPDCGARDTEWVALTGRGRVYTFTIIHHAVIPELAGAVPYNVALIELDGAPGAHLISNVVDVEAGALAIGLEVEVVWDEPRPGVVLPRFRPSTPSR